MKHSFLLLFVVLIWAGHIKAQQEGSCIQRLDTIVTVNNTSFHVASISKTEFENLSATYLIEPEVPIRNMERIKHALGSKYEIDYQFFDYYIHEGDTIYNYMVTAFRQRGKYQIQIEEYCGNFRYYPRQGIIAYDYGHCADQAFFLSTGKPAWNPEYSTIPADGNFRLTGLHDGQESVEYSIYYGVGKPEEKKEYRLLAMLNEVTRLIPAFYYIFSACYYIYDPFWANGKLYFYVNEAFEEKHYVVLTPLVG